MQNYMRRAHKTTTSRSSIRVAIIDTVVPDIHVLWKICASATLRTRPFPFIIYIEALFSFLCNIQFPQELWELECNPSHPTDLF